MDQSGNDLHSSSIHRFVFRPSTQIRHHLIVIELLSNEDDDEDEDEGEEETVDHDQTTNSKETDESIASFYQKFSAQLQIDDSTTNHFLNPKYVDSRKQIVCPFD